MRWRRHVAGQGAADARFAPRTPQAARLRVPAPASGVNPRLPRRATRGGGRGLQALHGASAMPFATRVDGEPRYLPPGRKDISSMIVDSVLIVVMSGPPPFSVYSAARASRTGPLTSGAYQIASRRVVRV